jgi:uridylate kinase|tara:strand:+ start:185 stop:919 length:735 start_codon:yes stop_codon:yes gene_type:complete
MENLKPIYKRVLLKLSGEALSGKTDFGIDPVVLSELAQDLAKVVSLGVQIGIVIGGGNLFRGKELSKYGLNRISGDYMGMLGTLMNALAARDVFEQHNLPSRVMSAIPMSGIVDHYDRRKAIHHMSKGRIVIFAAGTGNPLVTTDSAASLRGIEVGADVVLKATKVDGVYSEDPNINPNAKMYKKITFQEALSKELGVMDLVAFCQCRDHDIPIRVFNITDKNNLVKVVTSEEVGTVISNESKE